MSVRTFFFTGLGSSSQCSKLACRGARYPSLAWNVVEYLALFLIVTLHEFGHALACRQVGGTANKIVLWPLGGVAYVEPPARPGATLWSIAPGPLVNLILAAAFYALTMWAWHSGWRLTAPHAYRLLWAILAMNLGLLVFNLLPIYPLDGGQILRSLLWFVIGPASSLKVVAALGVVGAIGLIAFAAWFHAFWIGIIGLYIVLKCWNGLQHAQILSHSATSAPATALIFKEEYIELSDPNIQSRVCFRHSPKIVALQALGFQHFAYRLEVYPPYSAISKLPIIPLMFTKEVLVFPKPARLAVASILLTHPSPISIAEITGLGIRYFSVFSNGTLLISSTYRSLLGPGSNSSIIKNPHCQTVEDAWLVHKKKASELTARGFAICNLSSFADYLEIEKIKLGMVAEV